MKNKESYDYIRGIIVGIYGQGGDIQSVRNARNVLRYVTKYDLNPKYKNVDTDLFSFAFKARHWARQTSNYSTADPFILAHPQYYRLLREVHEDVRNQVNGIGELKKYEGIVDIFSWQNDVVEWFNDWVENKWTHKKKQLYLWGPANSGKTYFINKLVEGLNNEIYEPIPNTDRFAYQEFNSDIHKIMIIDEFNIKNFNFEMLKKALAGERFTSDSKGGKPKKLTIQCPAIMISNIAPDVTMPGFQERIKIVYTG